MPQVFQINKGICRSIEFHGIKAQYITYLALGFIVLLLLFVAMYLIGINSYLCLSIILPMVLAWYLIIQHYSKKYGEHGLTRRTSHKQLPACILTKSRNCFIQLSSPDYEAKDENGGRTAHLESTRQ